MNYYDEDPDLEDYAPEPDCDPAPLVSVTHACGHTVTYEAAPGTQPERGEGPCWRCDGTEYEDPFSDD